MFNPFKAITDASWAMSYAVVEHYLVKEHIKAMNSGDEKRIAECRNMLAACREQKKIKS